MKKRPECAGWHEPDPVCDGNPKTGEPECAFRGRCLILKELAGGESRTVESVKEANEKTSDVSLTLRLYPRKGGGAMFAKEGENSRFWRDSDRIPIHPEPKHFESLPLVKVLAQTFANELGFPFKPESQDLEIGDVYVRYLPGANGIASVFYSFTGYNVYGFWIARFRFRRRPVSLSAKLNVPSLSPPETWNLPAGVVGKVWEDVRPMIGLRNINVDNVRDVGRYIANLYRAGLVGNENDPARTLFNIQGPE